MCVLVHFHLVESDAELWGDTSLYKYECIYAYFDADEEMYN